jgi:hypothetical protein
MDSDVERQAQGERLLRYLVETGYFVRDAKGDFFLVDGAPEPDLMAICDRHGHVIPAIQDYISAIALGASTGPDTQLPSAV